MASMRNFLNLHPGYNHISWQDSNFRSRQQDNTYDCGVWAIANAWAWIDGTDLPTEVGLTDRVRIGRSLLHVAQTREQVRPPVPTDEVEYMGTRSMNTPIQGMNTPVQRRLPTPASRMPTPRAEELITTAMEAQKLGDPTSSPGKPVSTPQSNLSSARASRLTAPPSVQNPAGAASVTSRGSPMPQGQGQNGRGQAQQAGWTSQAGQTEQTGQTGQRGRGQGPRARRRQQTGQAGRGQQTGQAEQSPFGRRVTRHGKEY